MENLTDVFINIQCVPSMYSTFFSILSVFFLLYWYTIMFSCLVKMKPSGLCKPLQQFYPSQVFSFKLVLKKIAFCYFWTSVWIAGSKMSHDLYRSYSKGGAKEKKEWIAAATSKHFSFFLFIWILQEKKYQGNQLWKIPASSHESDNENFLTE